MKIAEIVLSSNSEGPGKRFVIWLQGCSIGCPNCINPGMLSFDGGKDLSISEIFEKILISKKENGIKGITFLGGEPLDQAEQVLELLKTLEEIKLNTILFTGYKYEDLLNKKSEIIDEIFNRLDVLIDGPYIDEEYTEKLYLRGSKNQRIIFLSDRIDRKDFNKKNSFDIIVKSGEVKYIGFPFRKMTEVLKS